MKIINSPDRTVFPISTECKRCSTSINVDRSDIISEADEDGWHIYINCPSCGSYISVYGLIDAVTIREIQDKRINKSFYDLGIALVVTLIFVIVVIKML